MDDSKKTTEKVTADAVDERAAFEAFWVRDVSDAYRNMALDNLAKSRAGDGIYGNAKAQAAWEGWQARAVLSAQPSDSDAQIDWPGLYKASIKDNERMEKAITDYSELLQALQKALFYWMPKVFDERSANDAYLLFGYTGDESECWGDRAYAALTAQPSDAAATNHVADDRNMVDRAALATTEAPAVDAPKALTTGAVEPFPYQKTFDAIAAATTGYASCHVGISVIKFREAFAAHPASEPQSEAQPWIEEGKHGMAESASIADKAADLRQERARLEADAKSHPAPSPKAPAPSVEQPLTYPDVLNDELKFILGMMCFQCISYAQLFRRAGKTIDRKAEAEQAFTIDWMLRHYMADPDNWRANASTEIGNLQSAHTAGGQS